MTLLKQILHWFQSPSDPQTEANSSNSIQSWESKRKLGLFKYILIYGLVRWALPVSVFMTLFHFLFFSSLSFFDFKDAIGGILAGVLFGIFSWSTSERRYKQFMNEKVKAEQDAAANP